MAKTVSNHQNYLIMKLTIPGFQKVNLVNDFLLSHTVIVFCIMYLLLGVMCLKP